VSKLHVVQFLELGLGIFFSFFFLFPLIYRKTKGRKKKGFEEKQKDIYFWYFAKLCDRFLKCSKHPKQHYYFNIFLRYEKGKRGL
jgi:hypothetical protein